MYIYLNTALSRKTFTLNLFMIFDMVEYEITRYTLVVHLQVKSDRPAERRAASLKLCDALWENHLSVGKKRLFLVTYVNEHSNHLTGKVLYVHSHQSVC